VRASARPQCSLHPLELLQLEGVAGMQLEGWVEHVGTRLEQADGSAVHRDQQWKRVLEIEAPDAPARAESQARNTGDCGTGLEA